MCRDNETYSYTQFLDCLDNADSDGNNDKDLTDVVFSFRDILHHSQLMSHQSWIVNRAHSRHDVLKQLHAVPGTQLIDAMDRRGVRSILTQFQAEMDRAAVIRIDLFDGTIHSDGKLITNTSRITDTMLSETLYNRLITEGVFGGGLVHE